MKQYETVTCCRDSTAKWCCLGASRSNSNRFFERPLQGIYHETFHQAGFCSGPYLNVTGLTLAIFKTAMYRQHFQNDTKHMMRNSRWLRTFTLQSAEQAPPRHLQRNNAHHEAVLGRLHRRSRRADKSLKSSKLLKRTFHTSWTSDA